MPADHGVGLDDNQDVRPSEPKSTKGNPKKPVTPLQSRTWPFSFEDDDLLAQGQNLQAELVAATDEGVKVEEQGDNELEHELGGTELASEASTSPKTAVNASC